MTNEEATGLTIGATVAKHICEQRNKHFGEYGPVTRAADIGLLLTHWVAMLENVAPIGISTIICVSGFVTHAHKTLFDPKAYNEIDQWVKWYEIIAKDMREGNNWGTVL